MNAKSTLEELSRCNLELWTQIYTWLKWDDKKETKCEDLRLKTKETPRELCKLSQYVKTESDKGNTTLKIWLC